MKTTKDVTREIINKQNAEKSRVVKYEVDKLYLDIRSNIQSELAESIKAIQEDKTFEKLDLINKSLDLFEETPEDGLWELYQKYNCAAEDYIFFITAEALRICKQKGHPVITVEKDTYLFNGKYWCLCPSREIMQLLKKIYMDAGIPESALKDGGYVYSGLICLQGNTLKWEFENVEENQIKLNFQNGTLVIRRNSDPEFREHKAEDYLTHLLPYNFEQDLSDGELLKYFKQRVPGNSEQGILGMLLSYMIPNMQIGSNYSLRNVINDEFRIDWEDVIF